MKGDKKMKYELLEEPITLNSHNKAKVFRIKALEDFSLCNGSKVSKGQLGGCVSGYHNLSQFGNCWVDYNAVVLENAVVKKDALLLGSAVAKGEAVIEDNAIVSGSACIMDRANIKDYAEVSCSALVKETAIISRHAKVMGNALVSGDTLVAGYANVGGNVSLNNALVSKSAIVAGFAVVLNNAEIFGVVKDHARVSDGATVCSDGMVKGSAVINGPIKVKGAAIVENSILESSCLFDECKYSFSMPPIKTNKNTKVLVAPIYPSMQNTPTDKPSLAVFVDNYNIINIVLTHEASATDEDCSRFFSDFDSLIQYLKSEFSTLSSISEPIEDKCMLSVFNWLKNEDFSIIPLIASNFFSELILLSDDLVTKGVLYSKKTFLCELLASYVYAQIAGIYLYGIEIFSSGLLRGDFAKEHTKYASFLNKLVDAASLDLSSQEISLSRSTIVFNEHMVNAVKIVCDFSDCWKRDILTKISEIDEVPLLELYSE